MGLFFQLVLTPDYSSCVLYGFTVRKTPRWLDVTPTHSFAWSASCLFQRSRKRSGSTTNRSFSPHAGLPHYSPQRRLWPAIRGESHVAHTLSILLLNSMNWSAAKGTFFVQNVHKPASGKRQTVCRPVRGSCLVADTDL